jgi:hypothetical protein
MMPQHQRERRIAAVIERTVLAHVPDDIAALHGKIQGSVTVGALPLRRTLILPKAIARAVRSAIQADEGQAAAADGRN